MSGITSQGTAKPFVLSFLSLGYCSEDDEDDEEKAKYKLQSLLLREIENIAKAGQSEAFNVLIELEKYGGDETRFCIGEIYEKGKVVEKDCEKAFDYYYRAASDGYEKAIDKLAELGRKGYGDPIKVAHIIECKRKDVKEGMKWYLKAAEQADKPWPQLQKAFSLLERIYRNALLTEDIGIKMVHDNYRKEAERGNANALASLKYMEDGGVTKDILNWYQTMAAQGDTRLAPLAQFELGVIYDEGLGVKQDKAKALELWKKAAWAGNLEARDKLSNFRA